jgi:dienelactone hydrolase
MGKRRIVLTSIAGAGVVGVALAYRFGPALAFSLTLALPATESWVSSFLVSVAPEEVVLAADGRRLEADVYRPARPGGGVVLVHGLSPAGRRHPDLVRLGRLLARHGQIVLVPHFEGLATFSLSGREAAEIQAAIRYLAGLTTSRGVAGFSFGAGPALQAAADSPGLRLAASFGGYADLRNVITYITTGAHSFAGTRYVQPQQEYNRWKLLALLLGVLDNEHDRRLLQAIAERKLANPLHDTAALERELGADGGSMLALVLNGREDAVGPLLAGLPPGARQALDRLSPLTAVPRLSGRLLIAHGVADDSIPFTESLRLAEAAGGHARVAIFQTFHHTGSDSGHAFWRRVRDGWNLVALADALLACPNCR